MKTIATWILFLLVSEPLFLSAQTDSNRVIKKKKKMTVYASWGYNREMYTKSTIHFTSKGNPSKYNPATGQGDKAYSPYDFTIYNAKAHDASDFNHIAGSVSDVINLTIPQFSARIGIYFNNDRDEGIELNYDHAKYVVTDGQNIHVKGTILGQAQNKDTSFQRQNFHFEHTDGANFIMVNYMKRWKFFKGKDGDDNLAIVAKAGGGVVYPRTDCTIFGERLNNAWHVAGFIAGVETGIRGEFLRHFCFELTGKAAAADYLWCFVHYKGNGQASQHFGVLEANLNIGYRFHANKPSFKKIKK